MSDPALRVVERIDVPFGFARDEEGWYSRRIGWSPDGRRLASTESLRFDTWSAADGSVTNFESDEWVTADVWTWTSDSTRIARVSGSHVTVVELDGTLVRTLSGGHPHFANEIASSPSTSLIAAVGASDDTGNSAEVVAWNGETGDLVWHTRVPTLSAVHLIDTPDVIAWSRDGDRLAICTSQCVVCVLDGPTGEILATLIGHENIVEQAAWHPDGVTLATASTDDTVRVWDTVAGRMTNVLEAHTSDVYGCSFSHDGRTLASVAGDGEVRFWSTDTWDLIGLETVQVHESIAFRSGSKIEFSPTEPLLALVSGDESTVQVWRIKRDEDPSSARVAPQYVNAKVVLVGDTSVGKTALGFALMGNRFKPTESTHARHTWLLDSAEVDAGTRRQIREIFLWDLAGQPGYRLVHQLHLGEVDVALVVFDARSETDPFAGVSYWSRALRQAKGGDTANAHGLRRFLVAARTDRGAIPASPERIDQLRAEEGFARYFETSAKDLRGVEDLAQAIREAIEWETLPKVSSTELFLSIKAFLVAEKEAGRLLTTVNDLRIGYMRQAVRPDLDQQAGDDEPPFWHKLVKRMLSAPETSTLAGADLLRQSIADEDEDGGDALDHAFRVCIGRVESQALIRRLSFGDYVLLQPELLDAYAASIVNAARKQPDGLGSLAEKDVLDANFEIPQEHRVRDHGQERILLLATVEELLRREIALREDTEGGAQLVFPSQSTRNRPKAPDLAPPEVSFEFAGPLANLWSTLIVRLSRSDLFVMADVWETAVTFTAGGDALCGLLLEGAEGEGVISVFFLGDATPQTRLQFIEYVGAYLERRAMAGSVRRRRALVCPDCKTAITDAMIAARRDRGFDFINCPVDGTRLPFEIDEELAAIGRSAISEMDRAADAERERQTNATVVEGKEASKDFDVFLCHNDDDKRHVMRIGRQLRERGLLPWLDQWELVPGTSWQEALDEQLDSIRTAAVFIGATGIGPWQQTELYAYLRRFVKKGSRVIPVLLPEAPEAPQMPVMLEGMMWVDFRRDDPPPMAQLVWGITGRKPPELD